MTDTTAATSTPSTDAGEPTTTDSTAAPAAGTTATAPADATSTQDTKPTEPVVPEAYDLKMPDGVELDQAATTEFTAIAKELKLPADAAKKFVDLAAKREIARAEAFATQVETWGNEVKADPELGRAENLAIAKKAVDTFGTPELRDLLNSTGMGNHPTVVRFMLNAGKTISEDTIVAGRTGGNAPPRDHASILYGNTPTK